MQMTLFGEKAKDKYHCIHCKWSGYEPKIEHYDGMQDKFHELEVCPLCDWVTYPDSKVDECLIGCYPMLKGKVEGM